MRLSKKEQWESRWKESNTEALAVAINRPMFRERHKLFKKLLAEVDGGACLEVGAYPGTYVKYFYEFFGFAPWGVEYVESCAVAAEEKLRRSGVPATILAKDFFETDLGDSPSGEGWDLTVSFGFVEHFEDPVEPIAKHIELTKPGGSIVISIPNHAKLNGRVLRFVDKEKWAQHNLMSLEDLKRAVDRAGGVDVLFSGYLGRFGFWNAGVYSKIKKDYPSIYALVRSPFWLAEWSGQWLIPNNRWTSPDAIVVLRKKDQ
jgi:SAM-dependent methyltransferase